MNDREIREGFEEERLTKADILRILTEEFGRIPFPFDNGGVSYPSEVSPKGKDVLDIELDNGLKFSIKVL